MNSIAAHYGSDAAQWAGDAVAALGPCAQGWRGERAALVVSAVHQSQCGVIEDADLVVAFKGFLHGPDSGRSHTRYDATGAARLVAKRYRTGGIDALSDLWGRYQAHILDRRADDVVVITDPYGSGEVYTRLAGRSTVASSISTLATVGERLTVDRGVEDFLLIYGFVPPPATMFTGIERLGAATALTLDADGHRTSSVVHQPLWDAQDWSGAGETDLVDALHQGFMRSLEETMPSDDEVAVLLGGFDSALVAAGLAALGKRVHTYTFRYDDGRYNQARVDDVTDVTGGVAHWVPIQPDAIADGFRRYRDEVSAPTNWPAYVMQTRLVAERIREDGFDLCMSGDGCDNLFFGYPLTFRRGQVVERLARLPHPVLALAEAAATSRVVHDMVGRPAVVGAGALRSAQLENPARGYLTFRVFEQSALTRLRKGDDPQPTAPVDELAARLAEPFSDRDPVQLSYLGKKCLTPSAMKIAASNDVAGVTIVSPYQHAGMVALAKTMPTELLRPSGPAGSAIGKYALASMAERHGLLPANVIHQPKMAAADAPIGEWYPGPLRSTLQKLLSDLPFAANERMVEAMFQPTIGERLYQRLIGGETNNVVNLHHDISLLSTYGAMAGLAT